MAVFASRKPFGCSVSGPPAFEPNDFTSFLRGSALVCRRAVCLFAFHGTASSRVGRRAPAGLRHFRRRPWFKHSPSAPPASLKPGNFTSAAVIRRRLFSSDLSLAGAQTPDGPLLSKVKTGGAHGELPDLPELRAAFFVIGPGVPASRSLGVIDMREVAPTLAHLAGLSLPTAEGKNVLP